MPNEATNAANEGHLSAYMDAKGIAKEEREDLPFGEDFKQEMKTYPTSPGIYRVEVIALKDSAGLPGNLQWVSNQKWEWRGYWINETGIKVTDPSVVRGWEKIEE